MEPLGKAKGLGGGEQSYLGGVLCNKMFFSTCYSSALNATHHKRAIIENVRIGVKLVLRFQRYKIVLYSDGSHLKAYPSLFSLRIL